MRIFQVLLLVATSSRASFCFPGGVLENVRKIQVDPTVIERPANVKDPLAAKLVRYNLRAAVRDALMEEGDSPVKTHIVLDEFSLPRKTRRMMDLGTGRSMRTVDGRLVIQDASGKELARVNIHLRGSVALSPGEGNNTQGRRAASDLEQRLLEEIEKLK